MKAFWRTFAQENPTFVHLFLASLIVFGLMVAYVNTRPQPTTKIVSPSGIIQCPGVTASGVYTPRASVFGISYVRTIIYSTYAYEAGVLGGSPPVADIDYMLPYAASEVVNLPGDNRDHYPYFGTAYVDGSGYVSRYGTPNAGRFAFLHMRTLPPSAFAGGGVPQIPSAGGKPGVYSCRDETGSLFHRLPGPSFVSTLTRYTGKTVVGWSGWPTWVQYGNGLAGPIDAHLCLVLDAKADHYFYLLAIGKAHPHFFPKHKWNEYRVAHHEKTISAYYHHKLSWQATIWLKHRKLRGIRYAGKYYPHFKVPFVKTGFRCGDLYTWNKTHAFKVVRYKTCRK